MFFKSWKKEYYNTLVSALHDSEIDLEQFLNLLTTGPKGKISAKEKILKKLFDSANHCKLMYDKVKQAHDKTSTIDKYVTILMNSDNLPISTKIKLQLTSDAYAKHQNIVLDKLQTLMRYLPATEG